ncbi:thioredoxin domain-containing protein 17 isoform X2 [Pleurodeles waltl]|uniref:thioredoxin domain-containing protein 17 isoform X2 n=1 Tax=Pleurodeles waltl TaxID=8319 RepID=UPI003709A47F
MANYEEVKVQGYDEFMQTVKCFEDKEVFVLFSGNKTEEGISWCPDCVKAEPVIRAELKHLPEGSIFIYCQVGERAYWKDPNNEFKKNLKLTGVPTLLKYNTHEKLVEDQCLKQDLVQMLFSEDIFWWSRAAEVKPETHWLMSEAEGGIKCTIKSKI